jgi:peptidoglycan/LPS O-acetylase OafA/YrhL
MTSRHQVHLDAARAVAALIVFTGHGRDFFVESLRSAIGLNATGSAVNAVNLAHAPSTTIGHQAVIVFFVLSGYLVGGSVLRSAREGRFSTESYLFQRLTRLWIVLIPALALTMLLDETGRHLCQPGCIYFQTAALPEIDGDLSLATLIGNVAFLQTIFVPTLGSNGPLWSLAYEFWYYMLFPLLAGALLPGALAKRGLCGLGFLLIAGFVGTDVLFYFIIWLMGAALSLLPCRLGSRTLKLATPAALLAFILLNALVLRGRFDRSMSDLALGVSFAACCYLLIYAPQPDRRGLYVRITGFLAGMSYTLYLTHAPVLAFISAVFVGTWRRQPLDLHSALALAAACGAAFLVAWAAYWLFERNTERVREWMRPKRMRLVAAPARSTATSVGSP